MKINVGNNNKMKNSQIGHQFGSPDDKKKTFVERHPFIISIIGSSIVGFIFIFSFWDKVVAWIEHLFGI